MKKLLSQARTRVGVAITGAALLTVGGTATAAVVATSPAGNETEVTEPTEAAPTEAAATDAPAETTEPQVSAGTTPAPGSTEESAPAATVDDVTEPEAAEPTPTQAAEPAPSYDPAAPWVDSAGTTFIPAPPPVVEPLPGEGVTEPN